MKSQWFPHLVKKRAERLIAGKRRTKQSDGIIGTWSGAYLSNDAKGQVDLAEHIIYLLEEDLRVEPIRASCATVFGGVITSRELKELCWRIAANVDRLRMCQPVFPYTPTPEQIEVPVEIIDAYPSWRCGKNEELGNLFTCRIIDGVACPYTFTKWMSKKYMYFFANELELTGYRAKGRFTGVRRQLVGVRFEALLEQDKYDNTKATFNLCTPGQFLQYNKSVLRKRMEPCPLNFKWSCYDCIRGKRGTGEFKGCPQPIRSCRPRTLVRKYCSLCGGETYHDRKKCGTCQARRPQKIQDGM